MTYKSTLKAAFTGYIVLAIVNGFLPLLFLTFQKQYGLPLSQITLLITVNFAVQIITDSASSLFIDRIGYRASIVLAHFAAMTGFFLLAFLPDVFPGHFGGLLIATAVYAIGGGLLEVLVSPIVEACPTENSEKAMSMLHSFFCWGHVGVVLISTVFFKVFGTENWRWLAILWGLLPLVNGIILTKVPINHLIKDGEQGLTLLQLCKNKKFWLLLFLMTCAGASEQAVSQWASAYAERGLGVSKAVGDLVGPMFFALMMGLSRLWYGKFGEKVQLFKFMVGSILLCLVAYVLTSFTGLPVIGLLGCGLVGFSVGILWPGTFSLAAKGIARGGTVMFAFLALFGDVGCMAGPTFAGIVANANGGDLRTGILWAIIFPAMTLAGYGLWSRFARQDARAEGAGV